MCMISCPWKHVTLLSFSHEQTSFSVVKTTTLRLQFQKLRDYFSFLKELFINAAFNILLREMMLILTRFCTSSRSFPKLSFILIYTFCKIKKFLNSYIKDFKNTKWFCFLKTLSKLKSFYIHASAVLNMICFFTKNAVCLLYVCSFFICSIHFKSLVINN